MADEKEYRGVLEEHAPTVSEDTSLKTDVVDLQKTAPTVSEDTTPPAETGETKSEGS